MTPLPAPPARCSPSTCPSCRDLSTLWEAALFAVNEAARQLVAARLKTHLGGPTETFAALDQALQRLAAEGGTKGEWEARAKAGSVRAVLFLKLQSDPCYPGCYGLTRLAHELCN